jgi:hypothetical protein
MANRGCEASPSTESFIALTNNATLPLAMAQASFN